MLIAVMSYLVVTGLLYALIHWNLKRKDLGDQLVEDKRLSQKIFAVYNSIFFSGLLFCAYIFLLDFLPYIHLDWDLRLGINASICYFILIFSIILFVAKDAKKLPKFWKLTILYLTLGCFILGNLTIYIANINLDSSEVVTSVEKIRIEIGEGRKGRKNYSLHIDKPNHPNFKSMNDNKVSSSLMITRSQKNLLMGKEEARFFMREGYFNMPYIWIDESYKPIEKK